MEAEDETEGSSFCKEKKKEKEKTQHWQYHKEPQGAAITTLCMFMRGADLAYARRSDAAVGTHVTI